jgi:hypothetical protein
VTVDGVCLLIRFIEHLQNVTTDNYIAIAHSNTLLFTRGRTKSSRSAVSTPVVAWWRTSTMSSASVLTFLPAGDCPTTNSLRQLSSARTAQKTQFPTAVHLLLIGECRKHYSSVVCRPLRSNGSTCHITNALETAQVMSHSSSRVKHAARGPHAAPIATKCGTSTFRANWY